MLVGRSPVSPATSIVGLLSIIVLAGAAACASGSSSNPGAGGAGGGGAPGTAGTGVGGAAAGTSGSGASGGGTSGVGGSATGAAGNGATAGSAAAGSGGPGTAGHGGVGGSAGGGTAGSRWTCPAGQFPNPFPLSATPTRIAGVPPVDAFNNNGNNFGIIEGPVWLGDALYVSEIGSGGAPPPSRVLKIDAAGTVSIAIPDSGSNGMAVGPTGQLLTANHKFGAITAYSLPTGTPTQLAATYLGARFNSPNDVTVRSDGNIYFTDPDYQAPAAHPQMATRVYRLAPGASTVTVVDGNRAEPNGITLSLDEKTLYIDGTDGVFSYPVNTDGSVGAGTKLTMSIGSGDGMAIDCQGNLYIATNNTLSVISSTGAAVGTITLSGIQSVTNAAFGGADHQTLYITALGSGSQMGLFKVGMPLPGMPF